MFGRASSQGFISIPKNGVYGREPEPSVPCGRPPRGENCQVAGDCLSFSIEQGNLFCKICIANSVTQVAVLDSTRHRHPPATLLITMRRQSRAPQISRFYLFLFFFSKKVSHLLACFLFLVSLSFTLVMYLNRNERFLNNLYSLRCAARVCTPAFHV